MPIGSVVIDFAQGLAFIGPPGRQTSVTIAAIGPAGKLQVGGTNGPVLRPLSFGARSLLAREANVAPQPVETLCAALRSRATVSSGEASADQPPEAVLDVLALHLAGAGEADAPPFAEAALLVVQATGWTPTDLAQADARLVDQLAEQLGASQPAHGWRRFTLGGSAAADLSSLRQRLAENLLQRALVRPWSLPPTPEGATGSKPSIAPTAETRRLQFVAQASPSVQKAPFVAESDQQSKELSPSLAPGERAPVTGSQTATENEEIESAAPATHFSPASATISPGQAAKTTTKTSPRIHATPATADHRETAETPAHPQLSAQPEASSWRLTPPQKHKTAGKDQASPSPAGAATAGPKQLPGKGSNQTVDYRDTPYVSAAGPPARHVSGTELTALPPASVQQGATMVNGTNGAPAVSETVNKAAPTVSGQASIDRETTLSVIELAEHLGVLLHAEADLRGLER